jgi:hypothetical protein
VKKFEKNVGECKEKKILGVCYTSVEQSLFIWLVADGDMF